MKRFGVSLEDDLLKELDALVSLHGFPNRSQAIRHLIRRQGAQARWAADQKVSGCVVLVYDHHRRDLLNQLVSVQHDYQQLVLSAQHVHLDHAHCLETIILKGRARQLQELADRLIGIKGMKFGQLVMGAIV
jgi:CopG family nickel-responsive transcriptional regulator